MMRPPDGRKPVTKAVRFDPEPTADAGRPNAGAG
jgi:hypothetical protein